MFAMCQLKCQPLAYLMLMVHPSLYRVDNLSDEVSAKGVEPQSHTHPLHRGSTDQWEFRGAVCQNFLSSLSKPVWFSLQLWS